MFIAKCIPSLNFGPINPYSTPQMERKYHTTNHLTLFLDEVHTGDSVIDSF